MSKFTAAQLVEFYQEVADGAEMLLDGKPRLWAYAYDDGPNLLSDTERWRIKPAKKIIDMAHFIESGIDMEFWDDASDSYTNISILDSINVGLNYAFVSKISCYKHCRPRMNHKMYWGGGACPLPEGFRVKVWFREGNACIAECEKFRWKHRNLMTDIIGYEILGLADGWAYTWES